MIEHNKATMILRAQGAERRWRFRWQKCRNFISLPTLCRPYNRSIHWSTCVLHCIKHVFYEFKFDSMLPNIYAYAYAKRHRETEFSCLNFLSFRLQLQLYMALKRENEQLFEGILFGDSFIWLVFKMSNVYEYVCYNVASFPIHRDRDIVELNVQHFIYLDAHFSALMFIYKHETYGHKKDSKTAATSTLPKLVIVMVCVYVFLL